MALWVHGATLCAWTGCLLACSSKPSSWGAEQSPPALCSPSRSCRCSETLGSDLQTVPGTGCLPGTAPGDADELPLPTQPPLDPSGDSPEAVLPWELGTALGEALGQQQDAQNRYQEPLLLRALPVLVTHSRLTPGSHDGVIQTLQVNPGQNSSHLSCRAQGFWAKMSPAVMDEGFS